MRHGGADGSRTDEREQGTQRFRAKRDAILAAAAEAINEQSAKGMTFADVARRVGLNTTSVTYYFKRKEDLAAAAFEHTLDYLLAMLDDGDARGRRPQARVARYLALNMARLARIERGEERADRRPVRSARDGGADARPADGGLARGVPPHPRAVGTEPRPRAQTDLNGARAHVLLENTFWLPVWLPRYEPDQYARVEARLMDVFAHGIAGAGRELGADAARPRARRCASPGARRSCSRRRG